MEQIIIFILILPLLVIGWIIIGIFNYQILEFFKIGEAFVFFSENIYLAIILGIILWFLIPYLFYKFFVNNIAKFIEKIIYKK